MIGKRLVNTGATLAPFDPLQNFETVTYTGNGGTQKITGYIRKGAAFNGSSSYINLPNLGADVSGSSERTVSAWIKISSNPSVLGTIYASGAAVDLLSFALSVTSTRQVRISGYNCDWISSETIALDTWAHVAIVYRGGAMQTAANSDIYINGNLATKTIAGGSTGTLNTTNSNYSIGYFRSLNDYYFDGSIDQVRIFNKALSSSEVTTLYNETYGSSTKSTTDIFGDSSGVALYELDEDALSSNFEQAASFNGSGSKIDVGNQTWFDSDFTLSMWFYPQNVSGTSFEVLTYKRAPVGDYENPLGLGFNQPNVSSNAQKVLFQMGGGGTTSSILFASNTYNVNSWNHVAIKISGTAMSITLNGTETTATFTGTRQTNTAEIRFGNKYSTNGDYPFYGKLDQIRVFDSALSSSDITKLKNEASDIPTTDLIAHYKLDGNATDSVGSYDGNVSSIAYTAGVYGGTPTNVNFLGMAFQPDLVWIKNRDAAVNHKLLDSIRYDGTNYEVLESNTTASSAATTQFSSFDSNGFTLGGGASAYNGSGVDYVAWCWKARGAAVSNTDGTITSQVSANQDAGFSIVKYTGNNTAGATVGHGLSSAPELYIIKKTSASLDWQINLASSVTGTAGYFNFNTNAMYTTFPNYYTSANSQVLSTNGTSTTERQYNNQAADYIAYCFHSVDGYQKIGSYTGNSSAVFVLTGFRPRFILLKSAEVAGTSWFMVDSERGFSQFIKANTSDSESFLSSYIIPSDTGFTVSTTSSSFNELNKKYIYLAIA